jgi:hypothetical protein
MIMSERIFLTYTNATAVPYQGTVLGHHVVLNYIDANGKHLHVAGHARE